MFIKRRKIINGYLGYETAPSFSEVALRILNDKNGTAEFKNYYGDYYVKGCVNGASMKIII